MKESMKIKIGAIIMIAFVLVVSFVMSLVKAIDIDPGNMTSIDCSGVNETINVSCNECNLTCPDFGVCTINTSVYPGESYNNTNGVCNVDVFCNQDPRYVGQVYFPGQISIEKNDKNLTMDVEIYDQFGNMFQKTTYPTYHQDIISVKFPFNFTCPADLVTDVNLATCSKYLNGILSTDDPVIASLSLGQSKCTQDLVQCFADQEKYIEEAQVSKTTYMEMSKIYIDTDRKLSECVKNLEDPEGSCNVRINEARDEFFGFVPGVWLSVAVLEFLLLFFGALYTFMQWGKG